MQMYFAHRKFKIGKLALGKGRFFSHNAAMRFRVWLRLGALVLVASCAGGQSGNEGETPSVCIQPGADIAIGLDDDTPLGRPRTLLANAASPQTASLRWYPPNSGSSYVATMLTYSVSTESASATLTTAKSALCNPIELRIDGLVLHFKTADGAFDDAITGTLRGPSFNASPTKVAGTYDFAAATRGFKQPLVWLEASFGNGLTPPRGEITAYDLSDTSSKDLRIATWIDERPAWGGSSSGGASNGGTSGALGTTAVGGDGGKAGSGG